MSMTLESPTTLLANPALNLQGRAITRMVSRSIRNPDNYEYYFPQGATTCETVLPETIISFETVSDEVWVTRQNIEKLNQLSENWNGNFVSAPDRKAITKAKSWVSVFFESINSTRWLTPNITADENGEVVFEWWSNKQKLTIYIGQANPYFIKVSGPDIQNEMEDGEIHSSLDFKEVWDWLVGT
jgi:hypothetical protein